MNSSNIKKVTSNLDIQCATNETHPVTKKIGLCVFRAVFGIKVEEPVMNTFVCQFHALDAVHSFMDQGLRFQCWPLPFEERCAEDD